MQCAAHCFLTKRKQGSDYKVPDCMIREHITKCLPNHCTIFPSCLLNVWVQMSGYVFFRIWYWFTKILNLDYSADNILGLEKIFVFKCQIKSWFSNSFRGKSVSLLYPKAAIVWDQTENADTPFWHFSTNNPNRLHRPRTLF